jgi:predicted metal-dependent hydrolase
MSAAARERWLHLAGSAGGELAIRVVDVAGARNLRLSRGGAAPRLSKPRWASLRDAADFAAEKRDWLEARLAELAQQRATLPALSFDDGAVIDLPLRGKQVPMPVQPGSRPQVCADADGLALRLPARPPAERRRLAARALRSFLEAQMRADVGRLLAQYTPRLGRAPLRVAVRPLRSLWGSLSARGHLSLDLSLVLAPPPVLEYVLVHELCHLIEHNHGPRFWAQVEQALPGYRDRQRQLRADGARLKASLERLLAAAP